MKPLKFTRPALRGLFQKPATLAYPVVVRDYYPGTRGHIVIEEGKCILCMLCARRCPTGAIAVDRAAKTWSIDRLRCIQCGFCVEVCPKHCLALANTYSPPVAARKIDTVNVPFTPPAPKAPAAAAEPPKT